MTKTPALLQTYLIHLAVFAGLSFAVEADSANRSPNIIFFLADDLGVECVGA